MAFSETGITLLPPSWNGADLRISWTSAAAAGTIYQGYINRNMVYHGTNKYFVIPMPSDQIQIDVGTVGPTEGTTNFSGSLPSPPETKVTLAWSGGTFEGADISGFFVYSSTIPGGAVDFTTPVATISAYTGPPTDGYGLGGFGDGGFGFAAASYSWKSANLASGIWSFAVAPFDQTGNVGTPVTGTATIDGPPIEPAAFVGAMDRLRYSFDASTEECTLMWNASPSA